jgi:glutamyl-tRNA synthetase
MKITHVIRGDDHVNNTPRQINILRALGGTLPIYGHLPMILGSDGEKLSKRHGAVSVMDYPEQGYLPEAMLNYLARLGWSHGDDEIFTMEQFCSWFDLDHLTKSPAQFNHEKLGWVNNHYIKQTDNAKLASLTKPVLMREGAQFDGAPPLEAVLELFKDRANTINELADACMLFYREPKPDAALMTQHVTPAILPALQAFSAACSTVEWNKEALSAAIKQVLADHQLKMPQLAMPLRLLLTGQLQTPSVDVVLTVMGRETVMNRLSQGL